VGYDVLTAMSLKMTVFKDVVQCILVDIDRRYIQGVSLAIGPKVFLITFKVIDVI
jgi:hypothetical protein